MAVVSELRRLLALPEAVVVAQWTDDDKNLHLHPIYDLAAVLDAAEALAAALRDTVEEVYGEDGFTYNPDETAALARWRELTGEAD